MSDRRTPQALAPFRSRPFRFQWAGDLLTSWAFEMETLILGWYILVTTGSVILVALFGALQYLGTLVSPLFGVAGDRLGPRNLLCGMRFVYAVLAAALMMLAATDQMTPALTLVIAGLCGMVRPSDLGLRNALIGQVLPSGQLVAALGISRTTSDSARVFGALAGAGLAAWLGIAQAYVIVTALYVLGMLATLCVVAPRQDAASATEATDARPTRRAATPLRDLGSGLAYVWRAPRLQAMIWLAFLINLTAYPLTHGLMPYVAREVFRADQAWLSYLLASFAFGSLVGSITLSLAGNRVPLERFTFVATAIWYVLLLVFAEEQNVGVAIGLLFAIGLAQSLVMVPIFVILLHGSEPSMRSRVMGTRMLAIYGLPVGLMVAGWLIERIGFSLTQTGFALVGLVCTGLIAAWFRQALWVPADPARAG